MSSWLGSARHRNHWYCFHCRRNRHLVFATLHTGDAAQTIDRIIDVFPPHQQQQIRIQLSLTLQGIVAQQLLPCKDDRRGRVAAVEVLTVTPAVRNLIREGKSHQIISVIQTGAKYGMQSMDLALRDLYRRGTVSYDEALARAMIRKPLFAWHKVVNMQVTGS